MGNLDPPVAFDVVIVDEASQAIEAEVISARCTRNCFWKIPPTISLYEESERVNIPLRIECCLLLVRFLTDLLFVWLCR